MRVMFVLPSLTRAGAETQVVNLVNGIDAARFEKHLFIFEPQLDQLNRVNQADIAFHHHPRRHKYDIRPAQQLADLIDKCQIDIVHCSLQIAFFMGWLAIKFAKHKPRLILALHTTLHRCRKDEFFDRWLYQWLMRSSDKVICVCRAQESHWHRKFPFLIGKTRVIYNGLDTEKFNPSHAQQSGWQLRQQLGISEQAKVICHIAAFRPEKGHRALLDTFQLLLRHHLDVQLLLAGDGELRSHIEEYVRKGHLRSLVHFLGNVEDIRPVVAASDCSVLVSSAVETFSLAMLESLAMEVPVVATRIGGTEEAVINGQTGLLVPIGDHEAMADALSDILNHHEERRIMGKTGREKVKADFSLSAMVNKTERLFMNLR